MPVNLNGLTVTGGNTVVATDSSSNKIFQQDGLGIIRKPITSGGAELTPLFNVGLGTSGAYDTTQNAVLVYDCTTGDGYQNVGGCFNTTNGRFTAPWNGLYLFHVRGYAYGNYAGTNAYLRLLLYVNGSLTARRPTNKTPYKMSCYGLYAAHARDAGNIDMIYLQADDYVQIYQNTNNSAMGIYDNYGVFGGVYLGD